MKDIIKRITDDFLHSFNGTKRGASAKKYTAFVIVVCIVGVHVQYSLHFDVHYMLEVLIADMGFVTALFGIGTYEKAKTPQEGQSDEK